MKGQEAWGRVYHGWTTLVVTSLVAIVKDGPVTYAMAYPASVMNGAAGAFCLALTWPVARRLGLPYAVLILATVIPPLLAGGPLVLGRITSVLFPVFIWLGLAVSPSRRPAWLASFAAGEALVACIFFTWRPLY